MGKDLLSFRESCTIKTCLCCGSCSVLTATKVVFVISVIVALLETVIGVCIITGGLYSSETDSIKTKLAILGVIIIIGQCSRIFVLTYWLLASGKENSLKSHTASAFCTCFSMIIILILLSLSAAYIAVATGSNNNYFYTDDIFNCTIMFIVGFDVIFSLLYGLAIAKLPPQYRVSLISEQQKQQRKPIINHENHDNNEHV